MMTPAFIVLGLLIAVAILFSIPKLPKGTIRGVAAGAAVLVFAFFFVLSSFRHVPDDKLGLVVKNIGGKSLPPGQIIATKGEMGPQARILPPGWHPWLWPVLYEVELHPVKVIEEGSVGLVTASDGKPLPEDATYAPEWTPENFKQMLDAEHFLTSGNGCKGPQTSVLPPGAYRLNPRLFNVTAAPATNIQKATVGVMKSNVGTKPEAPSTELLVNRGERGIWRTPLLPDKYYLNPRAYELTTISTAKTIVRYTAISREPDENAGGDDRATRVRTSDGFTFPVDVRIEYEIEPANAPLVVATVGNDQEGLASVLNSAVRAIFRNNAQNVKALDYVQQRAQQETQSLAMLSAEMNKIGVTVNAVRIGDVTLEETNLAELLKTQTDREIALQEQETFQEQQRAAEQKKELSRTQQEAEEEKKLATASYAVKIAEQTQQQRIIEAEAEAKAITIKALAQAEAYQQIAQQIGPANAALIEVLKIVGEQNIQITPRVMVAGQSGSPDGNATALIGTMLDHMISREEVPATNPVPKLTPAAGNAAKPN